jgi:Beta-ketoacyl synthase, N-terminal domain
VIVVGFASFQASELSGYPIPPTWRKATRNMILATASMERTLAPLALSAEVKSSMGLVLGSISGELETSADFLTTLSRQKIARPVLFQNSLHNATTGFASIHFRIQGPSFTISTGAKTPGESLALASSLIKEGFCGLCMVSLVEAHKVMADLIQESVGEGAVSVLLASKESALALGLKGVCDLPPDWLSDYPAQPRSAPLTDITTSRLFAGVRALES